MLEGELEYNYQKEAAKRMINNLDGVRGVTNKIQIKSKTHDEIEKMDIKNALRRNWSINDEDIEVNVLGNRVTLQGTVNSFYQREEAERIARNAPGVYTVNNELAIEYNELNGCYKSGGI